MKFAPKFLAVALAVGMGLATQAFATDLKHWPADQAKALDAMIAANANKGNYCLLYTSPSPRDGLLSRMPSSA